MSAVVVLAALMAVTLMAAPGVVGALIASWGYSSTQAGLTIGVEQIFMSLAAIPATSWTQRPGRIGIVRVGLLSMAATNLLCLIDHDFGILLVLRALTGLAGGSVMAACLSVVGTSANPERYFALWAAGQLALGAVVLALLDTIDPSLRAPLFYASLGAAVAASTPLAGWLGAQTTGTVRPRPNRPVFSVGAITGLLAVLAFYVAIGGVWTYLGRLGRQFDLPPAHIAQELSLASIFGIGGCCCAAVLGGRLGRAIPMSFGYLVLVVCITSLWLASTELRFGILSAALLFSWTLSLPYVLASVAAHDPSGRLSVLTNLMIGTGLGLGPALFALAVGASSDFRLGLPFAAATMVTSLVMALLTLRPTRAWAWIAPGRRGP